LTIAHLSGISRWPDKDKKVKRSNQMSSQRRGGILLHPTSLPGPGGIGSFGRHAREFLGIISQARFSIWQVLPLTPPACGNSPYSSFSAFAGNPLLIDLEQLVLEGDLPEELVYETFDEQRVDFETVIPSKERLLREAASQFFSKGHSHRLEQFWHFCDTSFWLHDYALFMALHQHYKQKPWFKWPADIASRTTDACEKASVELGAEIGVQKYLQWQFFRQWQALKTEANQLGIAVVGDLPIFVAHDSADVWCNRDIFLLDAAGKPTVVAGVPPDYFSRTGQLWGNPLYNWQRLAADGYSWWIERVKGMFEQFDQVRLDHFRGFEAAWHVPATARTAMSGAWVPGPGADFFRVAKERLGELNFIAEDLGVITPEVEKLRDQFGFPGMKILQFAFDSDAKNPYLPHNHLPNSVVYTGTHDNNTTKGWLDGISPDVASNLKQYLDFKSDDQLQNLIRAAIMSVADTVILPLQDLLGLPEASRMNRPGSAFGNWDWRYESDQLSPELFRQITNMLIRYGRTQEN
jgi:4-alpha-glucanotransferase